jgi:hypothetical protein
MQTEKNLNDVLITLINNLPAIIAAIISIIGLFKINKVETNTNSISEELNKAKFKEGERSGIEQELNRVANNKEQQNIGAEKEQIKNEIINSGIDTGIQKIKDNK